MTSFCRFTIGTPGASAVHVRYVSRGDAVLERRGGAFFRNVPEGVVRAGKYSDLRAGLEAFAWAREESEASLHQRRGSRGIARSHYRCVLSFEREVSTADVRRMAEEWLRETLPLAVVAGFVHRNTDHAHAHLWIDARGTDGKKLDFSPREWRRFGKAWERIYAREMEREDRLREKLGTQDLERREGVDAKGRASGGGLRAGDGPAAEPSERPRLEASEQALRECAQSRVRALREALALRGEVEGLGRGPEGREDRAAERGRDHR